MSDVKTLAHAQGLGAAGRPRRPREETARLGYEIYERDIRSKVEVTRHGKMVTIDVDSREYAIGGGINEVSGQVQVRASLWGQVPAENRVIEGSAKVNYEDAVTLPLLGPSGQERDIEAVVATGFNGFLTLPSSFVGEFGLAYVVNVRVELANGSKDDFERFGIAPGSPDRRTRNHRAKRVAEARVRELELLLGAMACEMHCFEWSCSSVIMLPKSTPPIGKFAVRCT